MMWKAKRTMRNVIVLFLMLCYLKKRMLYLERNIFLERGVSFMSWKQVYEQWATEESLEENLKTIKRIK